MASYGFPAAIHSGERGSDRSQPVQNEIGEKLFWTRLKGALPQPGADGSGLVGAVVIQDQMDFERRGYGLLNGVEKLAELHAAVPAMQAPITVPLFTSSAANNEVVPWRW